MVAVRGRGRWAPALLACAAALLAGASSAPARVALVAADTPELTLLDITTRRVAARLPLPGRARAVAVSRNGRHGFVAGGAEVVAIDVNARTETRRSQLAGTPISDIELSPSAGVLYATQGSRLLMLDARSLAPLGAIELRGEGRQLAVDERGTLAAVVLDGGRVAMVDLRRRRLLRRVRVPGATGVAIAGSRTTYVTARQRLRVIPRGRKRARKRAIRLPDGAGGALTPSPSRARIVVGAAAGGASAALVDVGSGRVQRLAAGRGPGRAAWYPDATRILMADGGAATISLVSPFTRGRIGFVRLPGTVPSDVVVQPGLAVIVGTEAADRITGSRGVDRIKGLAGDDFLRGGRGRDALAGGPGNDRLSGGSSSDVVDGDDGDDYLVGGTGDDTLRGGAGDDGTDGGTGNDEVHGGDGADRLDGGDGDDGIFGGRGSDIIEEKGFGDDKVLDGGPGDDVIDGGRGSDRRIFGGDGNDRIFGGPGTERVFGGEGDDTIDGGRAGDRLGGQNGDDAIVGDAGPDRLYGDAGSDRLDAGADADKVYGHEGNDELIGGSGTDLLDGGAGDDSVRAADDSADTVHCGPGNDTVYVQADAPTIDRLVDCELVVPIAPERDTGGSVPRVIRGTPGNDVLRGSGGVDSIFGLGGDDRLYGGGGDDYVDGEDGRDRVRGGAGDDIVAGRGGDDVLHGDGGDDRMTGDRGRDRIFGGPGHDTLFGNLGADRVDGGSGNDRVNVVRGDVDRVACGGGRDVVFADADDVVAYDCERVRR